MFTVMQDLTNQFNDISWTRLCVLTNDVVLNLASFIQYAADFFSFLEAFRADKSLPEQLEHLRQLGLVKDQSELWPVLKLTANDSKLNRVSFDALHSAASYYKQVFVHSFPPSLIRWLSFDTFKPTTEWHFDMTEDMFWQAHSEWTGLQITKLSLDVRFWRKKITPADLSGTLHQLGHLTALQLSCVDPLLVDALFVFACNSAQLTQLEVDGDRFRLTSSIGNNLIQWFERQPVRAFKFPGWCVQNQDLALKQAVDEVVFNCQTLEILECSEYLATLDFKKLSFPMRTLKFHGVHPRHDHSLAHFAKRLVGSGVRHLALTNDLRENRRRLDGIERLFQLLDGIQIKSLDVSGLLIRGVVWRAVATYLPHYRQLKTLIIKNTGMTNERALMLGAAIQENKSIQELDVSGNKIDGNSIEKLIRACTNPNRALRMKSIRFHNCAISPEEYNSLQEYAKHRFIEFAT
ncbi:hypothetical protein AeMF1_004181 [Aphanomyces euteiches]|nr:hypothetical protein AeMF1_004181 [Aphanomyces euteiches]KAH9185513.1 hypothetical protein AeNC1_012513 [Aphanomyces euteiches]